jgi:Heparinase II/III-like protein/Heparinase II/III N-terminus
VSAPAAAMSVRGGVVPRPVFCVTGHAYRDRAVADAVCAGRFTHAGTTLELGLEPDWLGAALPRDAEWRIEWTKFYYGLDLAHAFAQTGERRFLAAWERLVRSFIRQAPLGAATDTSDVAARRMQNWVYAWAAFASAPEYPGLAAELEEELVESLRRHCDYVRRHLTAERNHRTLELYALFIVALALPGLDADGSLLAFAIDELHRNLLTDVREDGVHREHSTHYHLVALRSFVGARENARRFGLRLPAGYDARLQQACEFALHCQRPDGTIPALSDADTGRYGDLLALAGSLLGRPDLRYAGSGGREGAPPRRRHVSFPVAGYYVQRSGWGDRGRAPADERFLIFDCGPLGDGGHGHYDLLSVEIAAGGRTLVVDPGRYTYSDAPPDWRRWFKGTAAHNTVVVDGADQVPYRRGKPRQSTLPEARLLERLTAPGLDVLSGEARSACYEARHTRRIAFVADEFWVIEDRIAGERPHRLDLRFHLSPEARGRTRVERGDGAWVVRAPGMALVFAGDRRPRVEPGWVSPRYGVKLEAPVVSVVAHGATATFATLVAPLADDEPVPGLRVRPGAVEVAGTVRDRLHWGEPARDLEVALGPVRCRAGTGWSRHDANGRPIAMVAAGVDGGAQWRTWDIEHGARSGTGERA